MADPETPIGPENTETKFYGVFDSMGRATAYYNSDIFPPQPNGDRNPAIPASAVEISKDDWIMLTGNPQARFVNGAIVFAKPHIGTSTYDWGPQFVDVIGSY